MLIHPSAISNTRLDDRAFEASLTKARVEASPDWSEDRPVSRQMENLLFGHYGWDPLWDTIYLDGIPGAMASPLLSPPYFGIRIGENAATDIASRGQDDIHLRSCDEVVGYRLDARDGEIGHVENVMLENIDWSLPYLIVNTSNWWVGEHVLMSVAAVNSIDWTDRRVHLDVLREQVKTSPKWDPLLAFNEYYAKRLHHHYGWPGSNA